MRMTRVRWIVPAVGVLTAIGPDSDAQAYAPADDPPLVAAVRVGDAETARELVEGGADVDAVAVDGTTALHWAAHQDDVGLARVLIEAGTNVEAANRYGVQPIALAATNGAAAMLEHPHRIGGPCQVRAAIARDARMAAELAAGPR